MLSKLHCYWPGQLHSVLAMLVSQATAISCSKKGLPGLNQKLYTGYKPPQAFVVFQFVLNAAWLAPFFQTPGLFEWDAKLKKWCKSANFSLSGKILFFFFFRKELFFKFLWIFEEECVRASVLLLLLLLLCCEWENNGLDFDSEENWEKRQR